MTRSKTVHAACLREKLCAAYPDAACELLAKDPWELLIAVILSARTSDARVNQVMAVLTEHYLGPESYAHMDPHELEPMIKSVPLYQAKARYIVESARMLLQRFDGQVPKDIGQLQILPGVGRKTASVVLGNAFSIPTIAVDVHVMRICERLGLCEAGNQMNAEEALKERFDDSYWVTLCHQLIRLGRDCCRPKRPWCSRCPIRTHCDRHGVEDER